MSQGPIAVIEIHPLSQIGEIVPDADLPAALADALEANGHDALQSGDILVVTQKIVSKAENCFADLREVTPGAEARQLASVTGKDPRLMELVLSESSHVVRAAPGVVITRHRTGHVMANAGIDRSNLGADREDWALLLPLDADRSARHILAALAARLGGPGAVVISDSFGRPWRNGVVNVAIGAAGLPSLVDRRGQPDRQGRPLEVTQIGFGDMVATAAGLAMGEGAEGVPAVLLRNLEWPRQPSPATTLIRPLEEDLFR